MMGSVVNRPPTGNWHRLLNTPESTNHSYLSAEKIFIKKNKKIQYINGRILTLTTLANLLDAMLTLDVFILKK